MSVCLSLSLQTVKLRRVKKRVVGQLLTEASTRATAPRLLEGRRVTRP